VYLVEGQSGVVAKVYHEPAPAPKAAKLTAMIRAQTPELLSFAAWPLDVLKSGDKVKGILIPLVTQHKEIHHLYSPAHRKLDFPDADWAFLVRAGRNIAATMETIHGCGHVVGDVNQSGILVSSQATVRIIDCDSFQVSVNGQLFKCDVGVPHFTPPELQGQAFRGLERTQNHDRFGLAVLVFHLLFMGRHPFAGRFHGTGDMPIERAIQQGRFAFSQNAASLQMTPPPNALRLNHVPVKVASLFERAFRLSAAREGRPAAQEWISALDQLGQELAVCSRHTGHKYFKQLPQCPWCEILAGGGPDLFVSVNVLGRVAEQFDLEGIWKSIQAVRIPIEMPQVAPVVATLRIPATGVRASSVIAALLVLVALGSLLGGSTAGSVAIAIVSICIAIGLWVHSAPARRLRRESVEEFKSIEKQFQTLLASLRAIEARHRAEYAAGAKEFNDRLQRLTAAYGQLKKVPTELAQELASLNAQKRELQLQAFLQAQFMDKAKIAGVGPGRKAVLASHGVETAWDITNRQLEGISGVGPVVRQALFDWRASVESRFKFDAARAIDPAQQRLVHQKYGAQTAQLRAALTSGLGPLRVIAANLDQKRRQATSEIGAIQEQLAGIVNNLARPVT
jgi:DNA-binding helix-hairpin-helix protein with protein kinase domain